MNTRNIGWFFGACLVLVLSSACGQSVSVAPKAPIHGETVIDVPSLEERTAALQAAAYDRPQDASATSTAKLIHVSNHRDVVDEEPASKIFGAIHARTTCLWEVNGRSDLGRFESQDAAFEAGLAVIPAVSPDKVDGELVISVGISEVCQSRQTFASAE